MRNILLIALAALCLAFPGKVDANPTPSFANTVSCASETQESDLTERILRAVEQALDYDYGCLCTMYANGKLTYVKDIQGYRVTIDDGGAVAELIILDI